VTSIESAYDKVSAPERNDPFSGVALWIGGRRESLNSPAQ